MSTRAIPCVHVWRDWDEHYARCSRCGAVITSRPAVNDAARRPPPAARRPPPTSCRHEWAHWDDRYARCRLCGAVGASEGGPTT